MVVVRVVVMVVAAAVVVAAVEVQLVYYTATSTSYSQVRWNTDFYCCCIQKTYRQSIPPCDHSESDVLLLEIEMPTSSLSESDV